MTVGGELRQKQYQRFWTILSDGLANSSIAEFREEMEAIAMHAIDPALREAAAKAMHRYDRIAGRPSAPFVDPRLVANSG